MTSLPRERRAPIPRAPRLIPLFLLLLLPFHASPAARPEPAPDVPPAFVPVRTVSPGATADSGPFRSGSGPVRVYPPGQSPCPASSGPDPETVWCFEGAGGDSTWPANPGGTTWRHWSRFDPPGPQTSRWHVTTKHGGASGGAYNAWAGCDSVGTNPACADVDFWVNKEGYGNYWNEVLELACSGQDATSGGTITFDLRYDAECVYDYLYLEYRDNASGLWKPVLDGSGNAAVFNGTSGNPGAGCDNGSGGALEGNYFDTIGVYGSSSWYTGVTFPLPSQSGDTRIRWRAESDAAFSDQDGRADTDGLGAIDNVTLTFSGDGAVVTDDFESGDFLGVGATAGSAQWTRALAGNTYDGWHLSFDPMYLNKNPSCYFDDTWMWAAKPEGTSIKENGFDFFLVSPVIDVSGWTTGTVTWHGYECDGYLSYNDWPSLQIMFHDTALGWSPWQPVDDIIFFNFCGYSNARYRDLTKFLGASVDSITLGWELTDYSQPGDFDWGSHQAVQYTVDNVSFGSWDGTLTVFTARSIDRLADTFSLSDPAHTAFLANAEQGDWVGGGGARTFAGPDSLTVGVEDTDGITAANVVLWWRHDDGGVGFGSWASKPMNFSIPSGTSSTDEGTYRQTIGADDGGAEDLTPAADGRIWKAGTTVEYYLRVVDDAANAATDPAGAPGEAYDFSVLPFDHTGPAQANAKILLVNGTRFTALDYAASSLFDPGGGWGAGNFEAPVFVPAVDQTMAGLDLLGLVYDRYDVAGAASSVQAVPRGASDSAKGLGGYLTDAGTPYYDAIVWLHGEAAFSVFPDTTRLDLAQYLDTGGKLLTYGDGVAQSLASDDPTFLSTYLGAALDSAYTQVRRLDVAGVAGDALDGVSLGLYGECPVRRAFDRLAPVTPPAGSSNAVVMEYANGGGSDDGLPSVIRNDRTGGGGIAVLAGFDLDALLSTESRACVLEAVLGTDFGISIPVPAGCVNNGTDSPMAVVPPGFELAPPAPNPTSGALDVRFRIPSRGRVTVRIYDVAGRRVRTLVDEVMEADTHVFTWDGRADGGERVASGLYFVRLQAGDLTRTRKAVLRR